jgi:hypothetical protein
MWVICDASVFGVGAMYGQGPNWRTCQPAGFLSKKFTDTQRHYCTYEQETIAILEALLKWEDKLVGYHIHVVMDHKALEFFNTQSKLTVHQVRWTDYLLQFNFDIHYVQEKLNKVADALSCYYKHNFWQDAPLMHHYIFADARLDPEHEDFPWERHLKIKNQVIKVHSELAQRK